MDSRDLLIIAAIGFGAWWLWKRSKQQEVQPAAVVPSSGTSSYVAGAAQQTQTGTGTTHGLFSGLFQPTATLGGALPNRFVGSPLDRLTGGASTGAAAFKSAAANLLALNVTPVPVALTPFAISSPTLGISTVGGTRPPPQQLDTLATNPLRFRGLN